MTDRNTDDPSRSTPAPTSSLATRPENDAWKQLLEVLDKVPFVAGAKRDITRLGRLVVNRRVPRLVAFGYRGCGRSRLANALVGAPVLEEGSGALGDGWTHVDALGRRLEWMELSPHETPIDLRSGRVIEGWDHPPDVLLLVATPKDVETGLGELLEDMMRLRGRIEERAERAGKKTKPALVYVLSQVDTLALAPDPDSETKHTPFDPAHSQRIDLVRQRFEKQVRDAGLTCGAQDLFAVNAPAGPDLQRGIVGYGMAALAAAISGKVPEEAQVEAARGLDVAVAKNKVADSLIQASSTLAITVALAPVPMSDIALIAPIQGMMVTTLAYIGGRRWDMRTAGEWAASVGVVGGMGIGFRLVARQIVKVLPGAGSIIAGSIAGAGTLALGRSAKKYFLDNPAPRPDRPPEDTAPDDRKH